MSVKAESITKETIDDFMNEEYSNRLCENKRAILFINCNANSLERWFSVFNSLDHSETNVNIKTGERLTLAEAVKIYNEL